MIIKSIKIILILMFCINISFSIYSDTDSVFRRIRNFSTIPSPPGINGENLFRNLFALYIVAPEILHSIVAQKYPFLSSFYETPIAKRKLEFSEVEEMGLSDSYDIYSSLFEKPSRETDLWRLFGEHFLHVLNTSGNMEKVIKLIQCIAAAEFIAIESRHRIGQAHPEWKRNNNVPVWGSLDYHLRLFMPEGESGITTVDKLYEWGKLNKEERRTVMALVYVVLIDNNVRNIRDFLELLSAHAKEELAEIKTIIKNLYIEESLKQTVLELIP